MKSWSIEESRLIDTPKDLEEFFGEIEAVCKKYGYSISHEDGQGAFEIEKYDPGFVRWLRNANLQIDLE